MKNRNNLKINKISFFKKKVLFFLSFFLAGVFVGFWFCVPRPLFNSPYATVVESSDGTLLGARIADDGQWRFPAIDSIPEKYEKCLLLFEDRYFYSHPGINPVSIARSLIQNIKAKKIMSGGSTISMQVCRMARKQKERNIWNKIVEMIWALNLELRFSKTEILNLYASHAPFGGNVVGLEAAVWRYFARPATDLSWAEAATLAVLPNAPKLIYPGKLDVELKKKRDRLLTKLFEENEIDSLTFRLSVAEPLPKKVNPLPSNAYHLVEKAASKRNGERIRSTVDGWLQEKVVEMTSRHSKVLEANLIHNVAVVVSEVSTREIKAYVGNVFNNKGAGHGNHVDIVQSRRSTGSILKPFLYCKMLDDGQITPQMLIPDIPIRFGGFTPTNFDQEFNGAVPAADALARSLNIPAVQMLRNYGVPPFYDFLKEAGMGSLIRDPDYYGLSLILGGAEISLWELTGLYTSMVSILKDYDENDGFYESKPFSELIWEEPEIPVQHQKVQAVQPVVRASSVFLTLEALLKVKRPEEEAGWQYFASARNIAWKTGTSFGFRDGWAVGMNRDFVVAVWVGNADGEGRPGLTGVTAAAPLLFEIFGVLPQSSWFNSPVDEMETVELCAESGYRPGQNCKNIKEAWLPSGTKTGVCPWHQRIHLNENETFRVNAGCYPVSKMTHKNWFVLPPAMEYYFQPKNPMYAFLPPVLMGCTDEIPAMEFVYPREWNNLFIPTDLDGTPGQLVFELVHRQRGATVFWNLNDKFLGSTTGIHQFALNPESGWHLLNVTDDKGNQITRRFYIAGNSN